MVFQKGGGHAPAKNKSATIKQDDKITLSGTELEAMLDRKIKEKAAAESWGASRRIVGGGKSAGVPRDVVEKYLKSKPSPTQVVCFSPGNFKCVLIGAEELSGFDELTKKTVRGKTIWLEFKRSACGSGIGSEFHPTVRKVEVMGLRDIKTLFAKKKRGLKVPDCVSEKVIAQRLKKHDRYDITHITPGGNNTFMLEADYMSYLKADYEKKWANEQAEADHQKRLAECSEAEILAGRVSADV